MVKESCYCSFLHFFVWLCISMLFEDLVVDLLTFLSEVSHLNGVAYKSTMYQLHKVAITSLHSSIEAWKKN